MRASPAVTAMIAGLLLTPAALAAQHQGQPPTGAGHGAPHAQPLPADQHAGQPGSAPTQGHVAPVPMPAARQDPWDSAIAAARRVRARDSLAALRPPQPSAPPPPGYTPEQRRQHDSALAETQRRGQPATAAASMATRSRIDDLPDGGRIELQRDGDDPQGAADIRRQLADLASHFADGRFVRPGQTPGTEVPGTAVMAAKRTAIAYSTEILPRGAALRITSQDPEAVVAIRQFLAYRRRQQSAPHP